MIRERIMCKDGFSVSIQGSSDHYCTPRKDLPNLWDYEELELGYPSEPDPIIMEYADDQNNPTKCIYTYVPWDVIEKLITKHNK